jgi:uroporphyrinogen-III synthase
VRRAVLITRPREDAARTAELVAQRGFVPVVAPFLAVRYVALAMPRGVQAVLVTSGNALTGLPVMDVPLLAVGDTTAAKARAAGFDHVESAGRDAAALVALAARVARPGQGPLLLASGARQGFSVARELRAAGFSVLRRVTYEAAPVRRFPAAAKQALCCDALHAALFLSAETAEAFIRTLPRGLAPKLANVLALAIGKTAADALRPLEWRQVRLADNPNLDSVLALL